MTIKPVMLSTYEKIILTVWNWIW